MIARPTVQTVPEPFRFTPNPLALGGTSNVWTVPSEVSSVYLQATFSAGGTVSLTPGDIDVQRISRDGSTVMVLSQHMVENQNDDGVLSGVTAGSMVRIAVDSDAFHTQAPDVTLTFHSGSAIGLVIAQGSVDTQAQPSVPTSGASTVDQGADTVTLAWYAGAARVGAEPHHYEVVIPGSNVSSAPLYSNSNVPQAVDSSEAVSLVISSAKTTLGVGPTGPKSATATPLAAAPPPEHLLHGVVAVSAGPGIYPDAHSRRPESDGQLECSE